MSLEVGLMGAGLALAAAAGATDWLWGALIAWGPAVLAWVLAAVGVAVVWLLSRLGAQRSIEAAFKEIFSHARAIVLEIFQTYVEALKAGRADGELTPSERQAAFDKALAKLRERVSTRSLIAAGGGLLAKWFGGEKWQKRIDELLGGAIETAVAESKLAGKAAGLSTKAVVSLPPTSSPPITASEAGGGPPIPPR